MITLGTCDCDCDTSECLRVAWITAYACDNTGLGSFATLETTARAALNAESFDGLNPDVFAERFRIIDLCDSDDIDATQYFDPQSNAAFGGQIALTKARYWIKAGCEYCRFFYQVDVFGGIYNIECRTSGKQVSATNLVIDVDAPTTIEGLVSSEVVLLADSFVQFSGRYPELEALQTSCCA